MAPAINKITQEGPGSRSIMARESYYAIAVLTAMLTLGALMWGIPYVVMTTTLQIAIAVVGGLLSIFSAWKGYFAGQEIKPIPNKEAKKPDNSSKNDDDNDHGPDKDLRIHNRETSKHSLEAPLNPAISSSEKYKLVANAIQNLMDSTNNFTTEEIAIYANNHEIILEDAGIDKLYSLLLKEGAESANLIGRVKAYIFLVGPDAYKTFAQLFNDSLSAILEGMPGTSEELRALRLHLERLVQEGGFSTQDRLMIRTFIRHNSFEMIRTIISQRYSPRPNFRHVFGQYIKVLQNVQPNSNEQVFHWYDLAMGTMVTSEHQREIIDLISQNNPQAVLAYMQQHYPCEQNKSLEKEESPPAMTTKYSKSDWNRNRKVHELLSTMGALSMDINLEELDKIGLYQAQSETEIYSIRSAPEAELDRLMGLVSVVKSQTRDLPFGGMIFQMKSDDKLAVYREFMTEVVRYTRETGFSLLFDRYITMLESRLSDQLKIHPPTSEQLAHLRDLITNNKFSSEEKEEIHNRVAAICSQETGMKGFTLINQYTLKDLRTYDNDPDNQISKRLSTVLMNTLEYILERHPLENHRSSVPGVRLR